MNCMICGKGAKSPSKDFLYVKFNKMRSSEDRNFCVCKDCLWESFLLGFLPMRKIGYGLNDYLEKKRQMETDFNPSRRGN